MNFSDVYGHSKIKEFLLKSIADKKIGHAYIFEGKSGIGRLTTALAFASALVCDASDERGACGVCKSCMMSNANSHPDIRVITNTLYDSSKSETKSVLVGTVRQMRNEVYIKPYASVRKIFIVPMADTMTVEAQNSLLKVFEEPPESCTIILIAQNSGIMLPTILSRAVIIKFLPLDSGTVTKYLKEKLSIPADRQESVNIISKLCGGSIRNAIDFLNDSVIIEVRNLVINYLLSLSGTKYDAPYTFITYIKRNKKHSAIIFEAIHSFYRDLMLIKQGVIGVKIELTNIDFYDEMIGFAAGITVSAPLKLMDLFLKYYRMIQGNGDYTSCTECLILGSWEEIHGRNYRG